jgi:hypothetical protein
MEIILNTEYFENVVRKMEMRYLRRTKAFKSYYSEYMENLREERTTYEYLLTHRGDKYLEPKLRYKESCKEIANDILIRSLYYCPIDTGALKKSSYIESVSDGFKVGYTKEYAHYVHELLNNAHYAPTRAKYLEDAATDIFNFSNELWTEEDIPISIYISYYPLYIIVTSDIISDDSVELLVSNFDTVMSNRDDMYEDDEYTDEDSEYIEADDEDEEEDLSGMEIIDDFEDDYEDEPAEPSEDYEYDEDLAGMEIIDDFEDDYS